MNQTWVAKLKSRGATKNVVGEILEHFENCWFESGSKDLAPFEEEVLAISCFVGEVANGGLLQFLFSDFGMLLKVLPQAFKWANLPSLEEMTKDILVHYPPEAFQDADSFWEWTDHLEETNGSVFFKKLECPFWGVYPKSADRDWFTRVIGKKMLSEI